MSYDLRLEGDHFVHVQTGEWAGYVKPLENGRGFSVHREPAGIREPNKIGVVKSIEEALPKLEDYHLKHPPRWVRTRELHQSDAGYTLRTVYFKWSFYGYFEVMQCDEGKWLATRCNAKLLFNDEEATFATAELARHVVDQHARDGLTNYPVFDDGYSWAS